MGADSLKALLCGRTSWAFKSMRCVNSLRWRIISWLFTCKCKIDNHAISISTMYVCICNATDRLLCVHSNPCDVDMHGGSNAAAELYSLVDLNIPSMCAFKSMLCRL